MKEIKVYGADWCPDCVRANKYQKDNNVAFEKIDVAEGDNAKIVQDINNGKRIIPTIIIDGVPFTNPNNQKLAEVLGLQVKLFIVQFVQLKL